MGTNHWTRQTSKPLRLFCFNIPENDHCSCEKSLCFFDDMKMAESKSKPKKKDVNVLLPCWALAYFPIMFLVGALFSMGDPFGKFYVFVFSGMALLVLTPAYALITILLTIKRIKNGTNTIKITLFQLVPLTVYIFWLFAVLTFGGSPA